MASVTPAQIWQALISAGASTVQAIGIMANMINESGLDPEAVGDQGTSFGLVQQHGGQYASLVTHNPAADMKAQIKVIAQNGGFAAASGATGAQAAGNFAANYERCVGCQSGGAQYNSRVGNAATVAGWVSSGKWPTSSSAAAAAASAGGGTGKAGTGNTTDPACAFGTSAINLHIASIPAICLLKKTTLRHIAGGLILGGGTVVGLVGAAILAAAAFQRTGALSKAADAAAVVPGGEVVAAGLMAAHSRTTRTGQTVAAARRAAQNKSKRPAAARSRSSAPASGRPRAASTRPQGPRYTAADERRRIAAAGGAGAAPQTTATAKQPTQAEIRAELAKRANQISRRVDPATA